MHLKALKNSNLNMVIDLVFTLEIMISAQFTRLSDGTKMMRMRMRLLL
jgi:hypothetical protein